MTSANHAPVTLPQKHVFLPVSPSSGSMFTFLAVTGSDIDDQLMATCAKLFSRNYGIWDELAGPALSGTFPS
jgi:hypothetical protein